MSVWNQFGKERDSKMTIRNGKWDQDEKEHARERLDELRAQLAARPELAGYTLELAEHNVILIKSDRHEAKVTWRYRYSYIGNNWCDGLRLSSDGYWGGRRQSIARLGRNYAYDFEKGRLLSIGKLAAAAGTHLASVTKAKKAKEKDKRVRKDGARSLAGLIRAAGYEASERHRHTGSTVEVQGLGAPVSFAVQSDGNAVDTFAVYIRPDNAAEVMEALEKLLAIE